MKPKFFPIVLLLCAPCHAGSDSGTIIVGIRVLAPGEATPPAAPTTIAKPYIGSVPDGTPVGTCWTPPQEMHANSAKCSVRDE